ANDGPPPRAPLAAPAPPPDHPASPGRTERERPAMSPSQRLFLTLIVLVALALIATSKRLYRVRRSRPMALLISGGWLSVGAGMLVGPNGLGAIDREMLLSLTPLMMIGLGWIGMMVGLQARREVLRSL